MTLPSSDTVDVDPLFVGVFWERRSVFGVGAILHLVVIDEVAKCFVDDQEACQNYNSHPDGEQHQPWQGSQS